MTKKDSAVRAHMNSAADVLQTVLQQISSEDPQGAQGLAAAYRAGAILQLRAAITASGLAHFAVELIEPNGTTHTLSQCELQREVMQ